MEILSHFPDRHRWIPRRVIHRATALGIVTAMVNCLAASPPVDEYQVKAAFIYNFAKFVQWPPEAFQGRSDPITICLMGQDPFGRLLEDTVANRVIEDRPLIVRHLANITQVAGCQILFISSGDDKRPLVSLAAIKTPGVLTIGDSGVSGAEGAIINFRLEGSKVRFDINMDAADREKLRISSRLLSVAHIVESDRKN
jgi:hypothetical protein